MLRDFSRIWTLRHKQRRQKSYRCMDYSRRLIGEQLENRRMLATLTVNTDQDGATVDTFNNGTLSLREAIALVNNGGTSGFTLSAAEQSKINTSVNGFGVNDTIVFDATISNMQLLNVTGSALGQLEITIRL